jgi:hypothetical protein
MWPLRAWRLGAKTERWLTSRQWHPGAHCLGSGGSGGRVFIAENEEAEGFKRLTESKQCQFLLFNIRPYTQHLCDLDAYLTTG